MPAQPLPAVVLRAHGSPPKEIAEFVGQASTGDDDMSVALMRSPAGWTEPSQVAQFDEVTVVVQGEVVAHLDDGAHIVSEGEAVLVAAGCRVRYETPVATTYVAICRPAFTPERVEREGS